MTISDDTIQRNARRAALMTTPATLLVGRVLELEDDLDVERARAATVKGYSDDASRALTEAGWPRTDDDSRRVLTLPERVGRLLLKVGALRAERNVLAETLDVTRAGLTEAQRRDSHAYERELRRVDIRQCGARYDADPADLPHGCVRGEGHDGAHACGCATPVRWVESDCRCPHIDVCELAGCPHEREVP